jgi:L-fucose mutarotase/ribose pyranase (RbsD/FucU family)
MYLKKAPDFLPLNDLRRMIECASLAYHRVRTHNSSVDNLTPALSAEDRIMMTGIPRLAKNIQLAIHRAAKKGQDVFHVVVFDGAAPSDLCHRYLDVCYGANFRCVVPKLLKLAPLNLLVESPVSYHMPDECDWGSSRPEAIRDQWRPMLLKAEPALASRSFTAVRREEVYAWALNSDCVLVAPEERSEYANLLLVLNPTSSPLAGLPNEITPELALKLAWMGHMNKCAVIGRRSPLSSEHASADDRVVKANVGDTVLSVVHALTRVWEPDYCEQPSCYATKRPIAAYSGDRSLLAPVNGVFQGNWSMILPVEHLDINTLLREISMRHIGAIVMADEDTDLTVLVSNGVTREPHQGDFI